MKQTIGEFIASSRKMNNMTQQELADMLNVSNKTISRWERDECLPDLSLLPAIAKIFHVTCDEILNGERNLSQGNDNLLTEDSFSGHFLKFKTKNVVAMMISLTGFILMLGIGYGFYRPKIGFAIMTLCQIITIAIAIITNIIFREKINNSKLEYEKYYQAYGKYIFHTFYISLSVVMLSLPFILIETEFVDSIITPHAYLNNGLSIIIPLLLVIYLKVKPIFLTSLANGKLIIKWKEKNRKIKIVSLILVLISGILFVIAPYFSNYNDTFGLDYILYGLGFVSLICLTIFLIVMGVKAPNRSKQFICTLIQSFFYIPFALILTGFHSVGYFNSKPGTDYYEKFDIWYSEYLKWAIIYLLIVFVIFEIIDCFQNKD